MIKPTAQGMQGNSGRHEGRLLRHWTVIVCRLLKWTNKSINKKLYSCSTFMLYLGVDKLYDQPHHQIYASKDYEQNLKDVTEHRITWNDPSIYVQNACITDPSLAPNGNSTLYVLVPVPNTLKSLKWESQKTKRGNCMWKRLNQISDIKKVSPKTIVFVGGSSIVLSNALKQFEFKCSELSMIINVFLSSTLFVKLI